MIIGRRDTIAAVATPAGSGGIGVVRISGPDAAAIAGAILQRAADSFPDRHLIHGTAVGSGGNRLDDVLAVVMRAPRSYTGEDVAEIHGHGGAINMSRLLRAILDAGARHAEAGEFTRRAFENGKLDLARAEAVADVIEASSERAWRLAQAQLDGNLGDQVSLLRGSTTSLLAEVEACIDFPEEGEEYLSHLAVADKAAALAERIAALASTFTLGKALREGIEVAIVGAVNSGKSSIFNRLIGKERAIVDSSPGTTRDFVEASAVWHGIRVTLIDTAGVREAQSHIEEQGIALGQKRATEADLLLCAHSALDDVPRQRSNRREGQRELHIVTKGDLRESIDTELLVTSALTGHNIAELKQAIVEAVCGGAAESDDGHVVTSERQRALLETAAKSLERASNATRAKSPTELLAIDIREAADNLARITGENVGEEVLDELFSRFCIGK